jgi:hypothetical protein
LDFDEGALRRLERLQDMCEGMTKADVIRSSLRLFEWLAERAVDGKSITVSDENQSEGPIDLSLIIPVDRGRSPSR